jgi:hypothetical protein
MCDSLLDGQISEFLSTCVADVIEERNGYIPSWQIEMQMCENL